jgi:CubicO group peptidase (beta-lactamase class C family)
MRDKLHQFVQKFMNANEIPGLAVGVVQDREILLAEGLGVRSIKTQEPVTATSMFYMASVSKIFVANAIMQLVEGGLVDLKEPVVRYLPYFRIDDSRYQEITVQQMLSHVSGMPDDVDYEWENPLDREPIMLIQILRMSYWVI